MVLDNNNDSPPAQVGGPAREPVLDGRVEGLAHHPDAVGHLQAMKGKHCVSVVRYENLAEACDCLKDEERLGEKVRQSFERGMPLHWLESVPAIPRRLHNKREGERAILTHGVRQQGVFTRFGFHEPA